MSDIPILSMSQSYGDRVHSRLLLEAFLDEGDLLKYAVSNIAAPENSPVSECSEWRRCRARTYRIILSHLDKSFTEFLLARGWDFNRRCPFDLLTRVRAVCHVGDHTGKSVFLTLNPELKLEIADLLEFRDVLAMSLTCSHWRMILWKRLFQSVAIVGFPSEARHALRQLSYTSAVSHVMRSLRIGVFCPIAGFNSPLHSGIDTGTMGDVAQSLSKILTHCQSSIEVLQIEIPFHPAERENFASIAATSLSKLHTLKMDQCTCHFQHLLYIAPALENLQLTTTPNISCEIMRVDFAPCVTSLSIGNHTSEARAVDLLEIITEFPELKTLALLSRMVDNMSYIMEVISKSLRPLSQDLEKLALHIPELSPYIRWQGGYSQCCHFLFDYFPKLLRFQNLLEGPGPDSQCTVAIRVKPDKRGGPAFTEDDELDITDFEELSGNGRDQDWEAVSIPYSYARTRFPFRLGNRTELDDGEDDGEKRMWTKETLKEWDRRYEA
ncbi:hypothetical protein Cob_v005816 [Colletotrichum orbiculare MAFF 240422]|uniref:Uncharacterized protein n=1 Tax=Colletotrichum orbiculare (strain 104-T / ATCC 96160 / CBS 514.97 / LARS 414 / MAFF 240422) TaxID=1213857 RepID=N4VHK8_COLOR|nr:hypothetical protein Cob_v005816 [Colletotrichum orbiculare MAFF 240422]